MSFLGSLGALVCPTRDAGNPGQAPPAEVECIPTWRHPHLHLLERVLSLVFHLLLPVQEMHNLSPEKDGEKLAEMRKKFIAASASGYQAAVKDWQTWVAEVTRPRGGAPCKIFVHRPKDAGPEPLPLLFWMHGGGFTVNDAQDAIIAGYANKLLERGVPTVWASVEYGLAPEEPFPAGFDDCLHGVLDLMHSPERAKEYGFDPKRVHIAGISAGGGLAAGLVCELQRRGGEDAVAVRSAFVQEPMLEPLMNLPAFTENGDSRIAPVAWLKWCWDMYLRGLAGGVAEARADPRVCPHLHVPTLGPGAHFIPQLVVTTLADSLRDDGRAYVRTMRDAGAPVTHIESKGGHATGLMFDTASQAATLDAWEKLIRGQAG